MLFISISPVFMDWLVFYHFRDYSGNNGVYAYFFHGQLLMAQAFLLH
jgi:hypothetical protein